MKVTRFGYPLENSLIPKLNAIFKRCTNPRDKEDAVLLFEGKEGLGKTTFSIAVAYYASEVMGRPFSDKNVFFDLYDLIKFAQSTENQIIIWDEPALNALSTDSRSAIVADLTRFLIMARKKRHLILINVAHFNKFNDYIVADRPVGMFHIYKDKKNDRKRFIYIPEKNLRPLWDDWRTKKKKNYFRWKSKTTRGVWPRVLDEEYKNNVLSEFDNDAYEQKKDDAIGMIGSKTKTKKEAKLLKLQHKISNIKELIPQLKYIDLADFLGVDSGTLTRWRDIPERYPKLLENA